MPIKANQVLQFKAEKQHYQTIRLILGDQLNADHSWFKSKDQNVLYVVAELHQEQEYVKHHVQKICAFFKSMENFATALQQSGHHVLYLNLDNTAEYSNLNELLFALHLQFTSEMIEYQSPDEFRLKQQLESLQSYISSHYSTSVQVTQFDTEHFILPFEEISKYFNEKKHVRMENFYRKMRKRFNILMEDDQPLGGQWNYDSDNRKTFKKDDLALIPQPLLFSNDVTDILSRLKRHQINHFGKVESSLLWPCNRRQATELLTFFCDNCLENFGRFQDAMTEHSDHAWSLYHSRISFALNSKMLHPLDVIEAAIRQFEASKGNISLSQIEGFVRQILGWREYVRGMYWVNMPDVSTLNVLNAEQPLPEWFWDGDTKMSCVSKAVLQSLDYAYAHHIQRLMITGNFALLAGLSPDEVEAWYLGIYIDAIEWVELPNTRGMALSADGGLIATKPYAASGNYINKMSDHCKTCYYSVKEKVGERACPFNSLYWHFLDRNKERFQKNPRMAFPYKAWQRMDDGVKEGILSQAEKNLKKLNEL
jgi:deoxyribodipyrimidine photolyase-related protein